MLHCKGLRNCHIAKQGPDRTLSNWECRQQSGVFQPSTAHERRAAGTSKLRDFVTLRWCLCPRSFGNYGTVFSRSWHSAQDYVLDLRKLTDWTSSTDAESSEPKCVSIPKMSLLGLNYRELSRASALHQQLTTHQFGVDIRKDTDLNTCLRKSRLHYLTCHLHRLASPLDSF